MSIHNDVRRIFNLLDEAHRRRILLVVAFMVLAALLQAASVASIYPFLAVLTRPELTQTGFIGRFYDLLGLGSVNAFLGVMAIFVFVLIVAANASIMLDKWMQLKFKFGADHAMSVRLLRSYLGRDYPFFLQRNSAELHKNVVVETHQLCIRHLDAALAFLSSALVAVALAALLFFTNPVATLVVIGIIGTGYVASYRVIQRRIRTLGQEYVRMNEARHKAAAEALGGIKEVKVLGREETFVDRFEPPSRRWAQGQAETLVLAEMPKYIIEALAMGGLLAVLAILLLTGQPVASIIPFMGLFIFAGYRLMPVFRQILAATAEFRFNEGILDLLERDLGETELEAPEGESLPFRHALRLEDATFRYAPDAAPTLQGVTVEVRKNTTVAFVGETGAGKTTLVDVLLGLLRPQEGRLVVDGKPLEDDDLRRWRRNIGYVAQDIFLTDDTIRHNIAFGVPDEDVDDDRVRRAARIAHIDAFVETLPDGYDAMIGERGVRISGGQRQRIGIARAMYHDPEVIVLDEATSDIDNVTEANITQAIEDLSGVKTVLIIAHRLSTIRRCDAIHVLDQGRIVGHGSYDELMAGDERFRRLANPGGGLGIEDARLEGP